MRLPAKLWRLGRIYRDYKARREVVRPLPIRLWIETASACNLRCPMCPNRCLTLAERGLMSLDLFRKLVAEARAFASDVYLHHRGEPLLNPAIFDMIACAREAGLRTRFHSNGTLLDEARARRLLDAGPDLVSFSVDGFAKEAYERIRVGARFETTVENIVRLVERRRSLGRDRPYVIVERIRFRQGDPPELAEDVRTLTRRFLEAGVDEVIAKEEYTWAEEDAPELEGPLRQAVCTFPWYSMVICWDGTVTPCPQDFRAHIVMGNAAQTPLREIWNGPAYRDLRRCLATDLQSLALCHKCDRLRRKTVGGVPLQYMLTFLTDQLVGYSRLRRLIGSAERN